MQDWRRRAGDGQQVRQCPSAQAPVHPKAVACAVVRGQKDAEDFAARMSENLLDQRPVETREVKSEGYRHSSAPSPLSPFFKSSSFRWNSCRSIELYNLMRSCFNRTLKRIIHALSKYFSFTSVVHFHPTRKIIVKYRISYSMTFLSRLRILSLRPIIDWNLCSVHSSRNFEIKKKFKPNIEILRWNNFYTLWTNGVELINFLFSFFRSSKYSVNKANPKWILPEHMNTHIIH